MRHVVRLAHFSDIHVTAPPIAFGARPLLGKRMMGSLNYYIGGRRRHFENVEHRIQRLLEDVDGQGVDHALCTGDITQMSFREEFRRCAELFGDRLLQPKRYTVLPGNHDRYTHDTTNHFEDWFGTISAPDGKYPFRKDLDGNVTIVGLDVARPTGLTSSSGFCGRPQLEATRTLLEDAELKSRFVIIALHYGLLRSNGNRDRPGHRIEDDRSLIELVNETDHRIDMVVHGHMHRNYVVSSPKRPLVCAGSATDLAYPCGYNIYDINSAAGTFDITRRVWSAAADAYVESE